MRVLIASSSDAGRLAGLGALWAHRRRLARFALVGLSGVLLNMGLLVALVEAAGLDEILAATIATEAAILSNFSLNDRWTFGDARSPLGRLRRAAQYNAIALGGLLISVTALAVLTRGVGLHYLLANLVAVLAGFAWNYALNARMTWGSPGSARRFPSARRFARDRA